MKLTERQREMVERLKKDDIFCIEDRALEWRKGRDLVDREVFWSLHKLGLLEQNYGTCYVYTAAPEKGEK